MSEVERHGAYLPVSAELAAQVLPLREPIDAALRGDLPAAPRRPEPPTPVGHLALVAATDGPLRAVVQLHAPHWSHWWQCDGCDLGTHAEDRPDWPCRTVELVAEQLGVDLREVAGDG